MRWAPAASQTRIVFLGAVALLWLGLILARLVELQILRHPEFAQRAQRQQQRTVEITPKRGVIYDRNHRELAISIGVDSVYAVPGEVTDPALSARLLAPVLEQEPTALENQLRSQRPFVWLKRKLDAAVADRLRALHLAGIHFQREHKRFYPKRELAAHVLGFVGIDENGLAGIEYALDNVIRGRPQSLLITADGRRRWFSRRNHVPAEGASIVLTLDENIQYIAERELAAAVQRTRARSGTLIVQKPKTGEILALANYPPFNPNNPTAVPTSRHVNRALSLVYEPGSTFKIVTIAAALEEGVTAADERIDCQQGSIVIAGHRIRDHKPFGVLSLREVLYQSSDVCTIKVGLRLGNEKVHEYIRRWGFSRATGIELPAESRGLLRRPAQWSQISIGAISMGQEVAITPLQLAVATSAIANGGTWVQPRVVAEVRRENRVEPLASLRRERIISERVAEELRGMLAGVVTQGTGQAAQPTGYSAAGKTGTAQKIDDTGSYSSTDFVASFTGFAPVPDPAITVVVVLDTPQGKHYHGGEVAAPVFRVVAERVLAYLNVPRDQPVLPQRARPFLQRAAVQDFRPGQFARVPWHRPETTFKEAVAIETAGREPPPAPQTFFRSGNGGHTRRIVLQNNDAVAVPDLTGLSLRAVGERCVRLGLEPVFVGSGVARTQQPPAGTRVPRGTQVWVEFAPKLPPATARPM